MSDVRRSRSFLRNMRRGEGWLPDAGERSFEKETEEEVEKKRESEGE